MKNTINKLNDLYKPILEKIEEIRKLLGAKGVDHALGFYNNHFVKEEDEFVREIYPIPVITCKLGRLNIDIGLDLAFNENYMGFIELTLFKEELLCFNFNILKDLKFEIYGFYYFNEDFYFGDIEQAKIKIRDSKETKFHIGINISDLSQVKTFIDRLFNNPNKPVSTTTFICDCGRDITIELNEGRCPICGKESPSKRKYKAKCPVCGANTLKNQYGNGECFHCGWHIDKFSSKNKNSVNFPNLISLTKAKKLYREGKPLKPDLNDFLEMLYQYSEVEFWYKELNCCVFLIGDTDRKIEFAWSPDDVYYFSDKEDFIQNAKIGDEYVRDIWERIENAKYI